MDDKEEYRKRGERTLSISSENSQISDEKRAEAGKGKSFCFTTTANMVVSSYALLEELTTLWLYTSKTITEILGWEPEDLVGQTCYDILHPDEIPVIHDVHRKTLLEEELGLSWMLYQRFRHKDGYYVPCANSYSIVWNRLVGTITKAENGPLMLKQTLTAQQAWVIQPTDDGKYTLAKWDKEANTSTSTEGISPQGTEDPFDIIPLERRRKRTAFMLDRFTDTCRLIHITNDVIVKSGGLTGQTFYALVKPSERAKVKRCIDNAKKASPIEHTEESSGGHSYIQFHVLKIADKPPEGRKFPRGTDESERHIPGQEFILVDAVFWAGSDGIVCTMERVNQQVDR